VVASPTCSPLSAKDKLDSQTGAPASKPAWALRLDLGQGEVVVAARHQRATATAHLHRQAFTSGPKAEGE